MYFRPMHLDIIGYTISRIITGYTWFIMYLSKPWWRIDAVIPHYFYIRSPRKVNWNWLTDIASFIQRNFFPIMMIVFIYVDLLAITRSLRLSTSRDPDLVTTQSSTGCRFHWWNTEHSSGKTRKHSSVKLKQLFYHCMLSFY